MSSSIASLRSKWSIFEYELSTDTGCTILFMQYQGPTTGEGPLYDGRMNLNKAEAEEEFDLNL